MLFLATFQKEKNKKVGIYYYIIYLQQPQADGALSSSTANTAAPESSPPTYRWVKHLGREPVLCTGSLFLGPETHKQYTWIDEETENL